MTEEESLSGLPGNEGQPEALFDRAFDDVYDFCLRLLLDPGAAAAATEGGIARYLALAAGAEPTLARAVLFREVLAAAAERSQQAARPFADPAVFSLGRPDPALLAGQDVPAEWVATVWEVMSRLSLEEYAFVDLHIRRGLDAAAMATIYGARPAAVERRLQELERELQADAAALITARQAAEGCPSLHEGLLDLPLTATLAKVRRVVETHCRVSAACAAFQRRLPRLTVLLAAMASVAAPRELAEAARRRLLPSAAAVVPQVPTPATVVLGAPTTTGAVAPPRLTGSVEEAGGPVPGRRLRRWREALADGWSRFIDEQRPVLPFAAALFIIGTAAGIAWGTGMFDGSGGGVPNATPTPTRTPAATRTYTPTPLPAPTEAATPTEEPSPTLEPTASPSPTPEAPKPTETPLVSPTAPPTAVATDTPTPPASPPAASPTAVSSPPAETPAASPTP